MGWFNARKPEQKKPVQETIELSIYIKKALSQARETFLALNPNPCVIVPPTAELSNGKTIAGDANHCGITTLPQIPECSIIYFLEPPIDEARYTSYNIGRNPEYNQVAVISNYVSRTPHAQIRLRLRKDGLEAKLHDTNPAGSKQKTFIWDADKKIFVQISEHVLGEKQAIALCDNPPVLMYFFRAQPFYDFIIGGLRF